MHGAEMCLHTKRLNQGWEVCTLPHIFLGCNSHFPFPLMPPRTLAQKFVSTGLWTKAFPVCSAHLVLMYILALCLECVYHSSLVNLKCIT